MSLFPKKVEYTFNLKNVSVTGTRIYIKNREDPYQCFLISWIMQIMYQKLVHGSQNSWVLLFSNPFSRFSDI